MPKEASSSRVPPKAAPPDDLSSHAKDPAGAPSTNGSIHHAALRDAGGEGEEADAAAAAGLAAVSDSHGRAQGIGQARPLGEGLEDRAGPMSRSESAALMQPVGARLEAAGSPKKLAHPDSSPALLQGSSRGAAARVPDASAVALPHGASRALQEKEGASLALTKGEDAVDAAAEGCALEIEEDGARRRSEEDGEEHEEDDDGSSEDSELESEEGGSDTDADEEDQQPGGQGGVGREEEEGAVQLAVRADGGEGGECGHDEEAQTAVRAAAAKPLKRGARLRRWRHWGLTIGVCMCLFGMLGADMLLARRMRGLGECMRTIGCVRKGIANAQDVLLECWQGRTAPGREIERDRCCSLRMCTGGSVVACAWDEWCIEGYSADAPCVQANGINDPFPTSMLEVSAYDRSPSGLLLQLLEIPLLSWVVAQKLPAQGPSPGSLTQQPVPPQPSAKSSIAGSPIICPILFNLGLTYGFTALGNQAGTLLPAAYLSVEDEAKSPYYDYIGGIFLVSVGLAGKQSRSPAACRLHADEQVQACGCCRWQCVPWQARGRSLHTFFLQSPGEYPGGMHSCMLTATHSATASKLHDVSSIQNTPVLVPFRWRSSSFCWAS
eukprot:scaffold219946_cov30-Tisochrysis_lutea.AAC.2